MHGLGMRLEVTSCVWLIIKYDVTPRLAHNQVTVHYNSLHNTNFDFLHVRNSCNTVFTLDYEQGPSAFICGHSIVNSVPTFSLEQSSRTASQIRMTFVGSLKCQHLIITQISSGFCIIIGPIL